MRISDISFPFRIIVLLAILYQPIFSQGWIANYPSIGDIEHQFYLPEIKKTADGGQILYGFVSDYSPVIYNAYILKTDQLGQQQWSNLVYDDNTRITSLDLIVNGDDGYLMIIGKYANGGGRIELKKIMPNGQVEWTKTIEIIQNLPQDDDYSFQTKIHATNDGSFFVTGFLNEDGCFDNCSTDHIILKIDSEGNVIWRKTHPINYAYKHYLYLHQEAMDLNGNLILAIINPNEELEFIVFDSNGDYQSTNTFFPTNVGFYVLKEIKFSSDNHLIWGTNRSSDDGLESSIYKIDLANNQIVWQYVHTESIYDYCVLPDDEVATIYYDSSLPDSNYYYRKISLISENGTLSEDNILSDYTANYYASDNVYYMVFPNDIECYDDGSILLSGTQEIPNPPKTNYVEKALMKIAPNRQVFTTKVSGKLYLDENQNCIQDSTELGIPNQIVYLKNSFHYAITDSLGDYCFILNDGTYETSSAINDYGLWKTACPDSTFSFTIGENDTISKNDLAYYSELYCPLMTVSIGANFLRRCFPNNFYVEYCNLGTAPTDTAFIEIEFGEYITVDSASIAYQQIDNNTYLFNLNEIIDISDCGNFTVRTILDCEAPLEATTCAEANIFPNDYCGDTNDLWDMSDIEVAAECVGDSIEFAILNTGQNMITTRSYIIYEDNLLREAGDFQLGTAQDTIITIASGPYTFRMTAEQSPFHPEDSNPQAFIEGCEGTNMAGVILTVPQDDRMLYRDIDCQQIIGSYDPNDKLVSPSGVGDEHFTTPDDEFEYTIRFQNVGNDTAFNIYILDTISQYLDLSTFESGVASHDYNVQIIGGNIIRWDFPNILLVDSIRNEPESHGFVKFNIEQKPNNPDGTLIENSAGIYFDFNAPIITPRVFNTIKRPPFYEDFCENFATNLDIRCHEDKNSFDIILSLTGGYPGTNGYNIVDNLHNEIHLNITDNVFVLGPFSNSSPIDLSLSVADHPECSQNFSRSIVDCITTYIGLLDFNEIADYDVKIYPNPANKSLTLTFNSDINNDKTMHLINKEGKEISTRKFKALAGENNIQFNIENLPSGIYFIKITDELKSKFIKFIKD